MAISLDPNADTLVCITQKGPVEFDKKEYKVLAAALSASPYWGSFIRHMNSASGFKPNKEHIEDTGITIVAVEIVLRGLHRLYRKKESMRTTASSTETGVKSGEPVKTSASAKTEKSSPEKNEGLSPREPSDEEAYFPPEQKKVDIDDVWGVLALINLNFDGKEHRGKFNVDSNVVVDWFHWWRKTNFATFNTQADFEKVLFPTFAFQDGEGFRYATKWLCKRTSAGNIQEYSPLVHTQGTQWYLHLHLPKSVICESSRPSKLTSLYSDSKTAQIRIARSKLRREISNEIWSIVRGEGGWLSNAKCDCWVVAHYNYLNALKEAGVLSPELDRKKSIKELVQSMRKVEYKEPLNPCRKCSTAQITCHLKSAIQIAKSFKGLPCLSRYGDER